MNDKIEKFAELEHEQWMTWAKNILPDLKKILEGDPDAFLRTKNRIERWESECFKEYKDLTEQMKEFDREWARKVLNEI